MNSENKQKRANSKTEILADLVNKLPSFCYSFLLNTSLELSITTRMAYARDLLHFFNYLIYTDYFSNKHSLASELSFTDLKEVDSMCISSYLSAYYDTGCSKKTVSRKRSSLSSFFNYMLLNKRIDSNPVNASTKVIIPSNDNFVFLTVDEQNVLLSAISTGSTLTKTQKPYHAKYALRDLSIVLLFLDTGMRVSELHGININDVDFDECSVVVLRKGGSLQTLYFSDDTRDALNKYLSARINKEYFSLSDPLFVTAKGDRLSVRAIQMMISKYATSSLPQKRHISPHKMRSSFAMTYYEATKDILALQKKLNHKHLSTTNIYAKATDKKMFDTRSVTSKMRKQYSHDNSQDNVQ